MNSYRLLMLTMIAICVLAIPLDSGHLFYKYKSTQAELQYYKEASVLNDLLFRENVPVHLNTVVLMLQQIDKNIVKFYPAGPFTRNDFIALGWLESDFQQYEKGSHGECGIFQIMPIEFNDYKITKNRYDIDINTLMAFRVLNSKFKKYQDYKLAIMAYNGLIRTKNGRYSQRYWKAFLKRKIILDMVLKTNSEVNS